MRTRKLIPLFLKSTSHDDHFRLSPNPYLVTYESDRPGEFRRRTAGASPGPGLYSVSPASLDPSPKKRAQCVARSQYIQIINRHPTQINIYLEKCLHERQKEKVCSKRKVFKGWTGSSEGMVFFLKTFKFGM
jgi:hypothetical protein